MLLPTILRVIAFSHRERLAILSPAGSRPRETEESEERAAGLLDRLCLALGLLTNLVQAVDDVKHRVAGIST